MSKLVAQNSLVLTLANADDKTLIRELLERTCLLSSEAFTIDFLKSDGCLVLDFTYLSTTENIIKTMFLVEYYFDVTYYTRFEPDGNLRCYFKFNESELNYTVSSFIEGFQ